MKRIQKLKQVRRAGAISGVVNWLGNAGYGLEAWEAETGDRVQ
jgi:hypothetical protein